MITHNCYLTVFLAVVFGGEFGLFAGVALAQTGAVSLAGVIALGTAASFIANTIYYYAGKLLWDKWSLLQRKFGDKVQDTSGVVRRYGSALMLVARFFYGIRDIVPIALGLYEVEAGIFSIYNFLGAFIWAFTFTLAGHYFSAFFINSFKSFQVGLIVGIFLAAVIVAAYLLIRRAVSRLRNNTEH